MRHKEGSWFDHVAHAAHTARSVLLQRAPSALAPGRSLLFERPVDVIEARRPEQVIPALQAIEQRLAEGLHLAGYIAYEAGLALEPSLTHLAAALPGHEPLVWFGCYFSPQQRSISLGEFLAEAPEACTPSAPPKLDRAAYERGVASIRKWISEGATYQANLTTEGEWTTGENASALYARLLHAQPVPYAALLHPAPGWHVASLSPELFFTRDGDRIVTRPMKGTAQPGLDLDETLKRAQWLAADEKNRAENVMIVDLLRNDLNRICEAGSVRVTELFGVERHPTVLQMTSTIEGRLRPGLHYSEIFAALFPSGSVVGAPKINTMRLLHGLEARARGVYTGAIGSMSPDGTAEFNVAIRTVSMRGQRASFGVGAGITWDSVAALEYEECMTKASFLTREPMGEFQLLETLLLERGEYAFFDEHLGRIRRSAEYFHRPWIAGRIQEALERAAQTSPAGARLRVRLLLFADGSVTCEAHELGSREGLPVSVLLHRERTFSGDRFLRHKTTRRALYNRALAEAAALDLADALFQNERGELTEGAIHNLVVSLGDASYTPPLASGVLPGIYREHLLRQGQVAERTLTMGDLREAHAISVCNSVRGLRPVARVVEQMEDGTLATLWESTAPGQG